MVDHGPDNIRWNLVIIGDGYRASELTQYHTDVQNYLTAFRMTPPFDELFCGINVHRIDVVSTDSGADDPGCAGGMATTANTYFDATFCTIFAGTPLDRLLSVNSALALSVASAQVPRRHQVLCIVNSSKYGGSGGSIATCSTHGQASQIAVHEIGHSAFGLADEYGGDGTGTPSGEPTEPNVTRDTNRGTNKWRDLVADSTPMPSQCNSSCTTSTCISPTTPPALNTVGTYEGAIYSDCNTYRPQTSCYMRDYGPFCQVCARVIRLTLQPFLSLESINLVTPSVAFMNVPSGMGGIGVSTYRAIVWETLTCRRLTFQITAGPTGGFHTPRGTSVSVTADPTIPISYARLWLSYTSTNPGDTASGSVTVQCLETGQTWTINIVANTIARPRSAVVLILDRSGSMNEDAGDTILKIQKLREASNAFLSIMQSNDGIGIVRFNESAQRLMEVQDISTGSAIALGHISGSDIDPSGATSIGDGVVKGKQMLDDAQVTATPPYDSTALVILTDGKWNQPPSLASISGSITANTYAVGLGLPSNISVPSLTTLCMGHNGYLLITGAISADQSMRLSKYFLQILGDVSNAQIAADPRGILDTTAVHRIPFWVCESDYGMDLIVLSPHPQIIDFQLESPDGSLITPSSGPVDANAQFISSRYTSYYRCALPTLPSNPDGSHSGLWHAILKLGHSSLGHRTYGPRAEYYAAYYDPKRAVLPYEFVIHTYSSLTFSAYVTQASFELGAIVILTASLQEYDVPLRGYTNVWAEIQRPDGTSDRVEFEVNSSKEQFISTYELRIPGVFNIRIRAHGKTMRGTPFTRERTLTAVAVPGGDIWSPNDPKTSDLCELIHCLLKTDLISGELAGRLKNLGIDLYPILKCLVDRCASNEYEVRQPHRNKQ